MFELITVIRRALYLKPLKLEKEQERQGFMDLKRLWKEACTIRDVLQLARFPKIYIEPNFGRLFNQGNGLHIANKFFSVIFLKDLPSNQGSYDDIIFYLAHEMFHQYQAEHPKSTVLFVNDEEKFSYKRKNELEADAFALAYCEILGMNSGSGNKDAFLPPRIVHSLYEDLVTYDESVEGGRIPIEVRHLAEKYKIDFKLNKSEFS